MNRSRLVWTAVTALRIESPNTDEWDPALVQSRIVEIPPTA